MRKLLASLCIGVTIGVASAQAPDSAQTPNPAQASALFKEDKMVDALPFYEALAKASPDNMDYQFRLTFCLGAAATVATDPAAALNLRLRAREAARRAVALGSVEPSIQLIAKMDPTQASPSSPPSPAKEVYSEAEKAFSRGDTETALADYTKAAGLDPKMYEAPLYAGDMAFRLNHTAEALGWYRRAMIIDPDRETAYRYSADMSLNAVLKVHDTPDSFRGKILWEGAEHQYEDALVAEPRNPLAWGGLIKWSRARKAVIQAPRIERPLRVQIDAHDPSKDIIFFAHDVTVTQPVSVVQAWVAYAKVRQTYPKESFASDHPREQAYRLSIKEESSALNAAIASVKASSTPPVEMSESLTNLVALSDAGMLDCWIFMNASNNDIARDYEAFRKDNRKLLHDYLDRFVIHVPASPVPAQASSPAPAVQ